MNLETKTMLGFFAITVIILICSMIIAKRPYKYYRNNNLEVIAVKLRNTWLKCSIIFIVAYYWCILNSILATLLVVYLGAFEPASQEVVAKIVVLSTLSLFTSICPYIVNFKKISMKYRKAYNEIETAIIKHCELGEAIKNGEHIISDGFED